MKTQLTETTSARPLAVTIVNEEFANHTKKTAKILTFQLRIRGHSLNSYQKFPFWFHFEALPVRLVTSRTRFRVDITREDRRGENSFH